MRESDFSRMLKVLNREKPNEPVLFEYIFSNPALFSKFSRRPYPVDGTEKDRFSCIADAFAALGYDYMIYQGESFHFTHLFKQEGDSISMNEGVQITDWDSFKAYPWPDPAAADYSIYKEAEKLLPGKMKIIIHAPYGVLENITPFFGYENLCYLVYDDPRLVKAACDAVGERLVEWYRRCLSYDSVGAAFYNDDWGHNTGPVFSMDFFQEYIFPWVRKIVDLIHKNGKPALLHSCGKLDSMMDAIIDDLKFDGKHSFQDVIEPVEEAYPRYKDRIAILGGIDLDFIIRAPKKAIYERSANMLKLGKTGYALGTGNSIPYYVPLDNFTTMLSAAGLSDYKEYF